MKTHAELNLRKLHYRNLIHHALWLYDNAKRIEKLHAFNMRVFAATRSANYMGLDTARRVLHEVDEKNKNECGTSGCVIGHALHSGVCIERPLSVLRSITAKKMKRRDIDWYMWNVLSAEAFGIAHTASLWDFLFGTQNPDSIVAASERIFWFLENGTKKIEELERRARSSARKIAFLTPLIVVHRISLKYRLLRFNPKQEFYALDPGYKWKPKLEAWRKKLQRLNRELGIDADTVLVEN